jgi:hypothetical protein
VYDSTWLGIKKKNGQLALGDRDCGQPLSMFTQLLHYYSGWLELCHPNKEVNDGVIKWLSHVQAYRMLI